MKTLLALAVSLTLLVGCVTLDNSFFQSADFQTLKEMGYIAVFTAAGDGDNDEIRANIDRYVQSKGYANWQGVVRTVANNLAFMLDDQVGGVVQNEAILAEVRSIISILVVLYGDELTGIFDEAGVDILPVAVV